MKHVFPRSADIRRKRIAVCGYGVEGNQTTVFLHAHGAAVTIVDDKPETAFAADQLQVLGESGISHTFGGIPDLSGFDAIVRSPGINPMHPALVSARAAGVPMTSATQLFLDFCPAPVIGVTGTKGKGTTSSLITEMLRASGHVAYLGGNIGVPALAFLDQLTPEARVVLELSSFQLMDLESSPGIAVVLMVTVEHQDYHGSADEYVQAKSGIVRYQQQTDTAVVNQDYENSRRIGRQAPGRRWGVSTHGPVSPGCFVRNGMVVFSDGTREEEILAVSDIFIPGKHNWENVCAAVCAAKAAGVATPAIATVLKTFRGLVHRLEYVRTVDAVRYFDDSFSTTPETAMAALDAFTQPKVLILGGSSKQSDFSQLGQALAVCTSLRGIVGIGVEWQRIKQTIPHLDGSVAVVEGCRTMAEIVQAARSLAQSGDVVILSPACASFDMFKNYKDRGDQFKQQVAALPDTGGGKEKRT